MMLLELADSTVNIAVRPWVKSYDYWAVRADLLENIKQAVDGEGSWLTSNRFASRQRT